TNGRTRGECMQSSFLPLCAAAILSPLLAACVQQVGDTDRTQPDAVERSIFQGDDEWYYRQPVVEAEHGERAGGAVFQPLEGRLHRLRWEPTEGGRLAPATVGPADGIYDGRADYEAGRYAVVAAFPIESHFDKERTHDATGGSSIVEDDTTRRWWERDYMRVDWSTNLVSEITGVGGIG